MCGEGGDIDKQFWGHSESPVSTLASWGLTSTSVRVSVGMAFSKGQFICHTKRCSLI